MKSKIILFVSLISALLLFDCSFAASESLNSPVRIEKVEKSPWVVAIQENGQVLTNGQYQLNTGEPSQSLTRFNPNGSIDFKFGRIIGEIFPASRLIVNSYPRWEPQVSAILVGSDGKIYVAWWRFRDKDQKHYSGVVRLMPDGSKDETFLIGGESPFNGEIRVMRTDSQGRLLVGGRFTTFQDLNAGRLFRFLPNGAADPEFKIGSGFEWEHSVVHDIQLMSDGKILVGGDFWQYQGRRDEGVGHDIALLNPDASQVEAFARASWTPSRFDVFAVTFDKNGKILFGSSHNITRLNNDGSLDQSFRDLSKSFNSADDNISFIRALVVQDDGRLLVGGSFSSFDGAPVGNLFRLNPDQTLDKEFSENMGTGIKKSGGSQYEVTALAVQPDGGIIVAGDFDEFNGRKVNSPMRLKSNGSLDRAF